MVCVITRVDPTGFFCVWIRSLSTQGVNWNSNHNELSQHFSFGNPKIFQLSLFWEIEFIATQAIYPSIWRGISRQLKIVSKARIPSSWRKTPNFHGMFPYISEIQPTRIPSNKSIASLSSPHLETTDVQIAVPTDQNTHLAERKRWEWRFFI